MNFPDIFLYVAPVIGSVTLIIGICAIIRPEPMSTKFGITASAAALPYVVSTGIRDVFIGLTVLILFYLQQWLALGLINLGVGIVAISDFRVVHKYGNKKTSYVHLFAAIAAVIFAGWLLQNRV